MTKEAALYKFFSGFGISAYPDTSVPDDTVFPYITYSVITGNWGDSPASLTVNVWYYTESEATPNAKVKEISEAIGLGGVLLPCDEGVIWLNMGTPWCQNLSDDSDHNVKRRYLNVYASYHTI